MESIAYKQFLELEREHWWFRGRRSVYFGILTHHLQGSRPQRVLDFGCGPGGFLEGLDELGDKVYPADISIENLAHCSERGFPGGIVSDGYALPYEDESFDLVCMFDAIEHIEDAERVLREIKRILKPGGLALASVPAYQFLFANNDRISHHYRRYSRKLLRDTFEQAGLKMERNTHANVFLFPVILLAVPAIKCIEKLFPKMLDPNQTNLSWPIPAFVHSILHGIFKAELPFSKRFDWPVGHSIVGIGRRPSAS